jgi:urea transporter
LVGTIVYFGIGWLVFEGLLGKYMSANTTQIVGFKKSEEEASMVMLIVSCAAYALLLAIVMGNWTQVNTFKEGAILGATFGILVATMTNSYWYSTSHFFNGFAPLLVDIAAAGVTVGIMGGVIAWVLGK